jgi:acyl carrier protein
VDTHVVTNVEPDIHLDSDLDPIDHTYLVADRDTHLDSDLVPDHHADLDADRIPYRHADVEPDTHLDSNMDSIDFAHLVADHNTYLDSNLVAHCHIHVDADRISYRHADVEPDIHLDANMDSIDFAHLVAHLVSDGIPLVHSHGHTDLDSYHQPDLDTHRDAFRDAVGYAFCRAADRQIRQRGPGQPGRHHHLCPGRAQCGRLQS